MYVWAVLILLTDRVSKSLTLRNLSPGESRPLIDGVLHLTYVQNRGAAFGMFSDWSVLITILAAFLTVAIIWFYHAYLAGSFEGPLAGVAVGLIVGGACGNLIDRALWGYVVDFVDLRVWPVFNIADGAVTVGAALMITLILKGEVLKTEKNMGTGEEAEEGV